MEEWRSLDVQRGRGGEFVGRVDVGDVLTQRRRDAEYAEMLGRVERVERVEGESVSQGAPSLRDGAMKREYSHQ